MRVIDIINIEQKSFTEVGFFDTHIDDDHHHNNVDVPHHMEIQVIIQEKKVKKLKHSMVLGVFIHILIVKI